MRILVHICCGPCGITVVQRLREQGHKLTGLFFNPNIQPLTEYMRRREGAALMAGRMHFPLLFADSLPEPEQRWSDPWLRESWEEEWSGAGIPLPAVDPVPWLRAVAGRETERCLFCWRLRLQKTAELATNRRFDAFTSSLLYSRYQNHEAIRDIGKSMDSAEGPAFVYEDFRVFWQEGVRLSKDWGIFRQQYCGCLYSEYERYNRDFSRLLHTSEAGC